MLQLNDLAGVLTVLTAIVGLLTAVVGLFVGVRQLHKHTGGAKWVVWLGAGLGVLLCVCTVGAFILVAWKPTPQTSSPSQRKPVAPDHAQVIVRRDLERLPIEARENRRYLSLVHLHNDPQVAHGALVSLRDGLADLAGYLSPAGTVASLPPVDDEHLVFAIDWPEFGTPTATVWRAVLTAYPYGLEKPDGTGAAFRKLSGSALPVVRGDWFLRAALKPPLGGPGGPLYRMGTVPAALQKFARQYDEQRIDAALAAAELGAAGAKDVVDKVRAEKHLIESYGLGPLADGGSVTRATWESTAFSTSPYQELARSLGIGTPLRGD
jgi:hypothetical protein